MGMTYKRGNIWWLKYYRNGKSIRESSKSKSKMVADRLLKRREGEIANGITPAICFQKTTFENLAEIVLQDYKINAKKSIDRVERSIAHLSSKFAGMKAVQITSPVINEYIISRLESGAANGTINRELSALKRMFNLGSQQTPPLVDRAPYVSSLKERNARKGFFEHWEFLALREALPDYLKGFVTFAYKFGWRLEEIGCLKWNQVDRKLGIVRLEVGETKNDAGRTIYLDEELKEVFNSQWEKLSTLRKCSRMFF